MAYDGRVTFDTHLDGMGLQKGLQENLGKVGQIIKGFAGFEILKRGFDALKNSIGDAVAQYDTLAKFPRMMQAMGHSTDESAAAMAKLRAGIVGLPTALSDVVGTAQKLAVLTGNLDEAADLTIALNNAFMASGASAQDAARGTLQFSQMLSVGKVDIMSWRIMAETMPYALKQVAEGFGFAGASAQNDLYAALQSGAVTFDEFNAMILKANEGVGGFAEVAKTAGGGIGTAFGQLRLRMIEGVAGIVTAIDNGLSKTRFGNIEGMIKAFAGVVGGALKGVAAVFKVVAQNADVLAVAVGAFLAVMAAHKVVTAATAAVTAYKTAMAGLAMGMLAYNTAAAAGTAATGAFTLSQALATITVGAFTKGVGLATAAKTAFAAASAAAKLGLVGLGIAAAAGAMYLGVKLVNAIIGVSQEYTRNKKELKDLAKEQKGYEEVMRGNINAAVEDAAAKNVQADANASLLTGLSLLVDAQGRWNGTAEQARAAAEQANAAIEGLALTYDETTGRLNMTNTELVEYAKNLRLATAAETARDQYNAALSEQTQLQAKINVLQSKQKAYYDMMKAGTISRKEYNLLMRDSNKILGGYESTMKTLTVDVEAYRRVASEAANTDASAAVMRQQIMNTQMNDVRRLAYQYGISNEEILDGASRLTGGLEEWAQLRQQTHTREGYDVEQLAAQWGLSAEQIRESLEITGMTLQEWSDEVTAKVDNVINDFNLLPTKTKVSLDQMIKNMNTNAENTRKWKDLMIEIGGQLEPGMRAEFDRMGVSSLEALEALKKGGKEKIEEANEAYRNAAAAGAEAMVEEYDSNKPDFEEVGTGLANSVIDSYKKKYTAARTAGKGLIQAILGSMKEAAQMRSPAKLFVAVGKGIDEGVAVGLSDERGASVKGAAALVQSAHDAAVTQNERAARAGVVSNVYNSTVGGAVSDARTTVTNNYTFNSPQALGLRDVRREMLLAEQRQRLGVQYG